MYKSGIFQQTMLDYRRSCVVIILPMEIATWGCLSGQANFDEAPNDTQILTGGNRNKNVNQQDMLYTLQVAPTKCHFSQPFEIHSIRTFHTYTHIHIYIYTYTYMYVFHLYYGDRYFLTNFFDLTLSLADLSIF